MSVGAVVDNEIRRGDRASAIVVATPRRTANATPVFVDDSGRRAGIVRTIGVVVLMALAVSGIGFAVALVRAETVYRVPPETPRAELVVGSGSA